MSGERTKVTRLSTARRKTSGPASIPRPALREGLQVGTIEEARKANRFAVRFVDGELVEATVQTPCSVELVRECMRGARPVLLTATAAGYAILGTIQTAPMVERAAEGGTLALSGRDIRLDATRAVRIGAGRSAVELTSDGKLRVVGERLTLDVAALVRFLSAKVELP